VKCKKLAKIQFPESLLSIGSHAFGDCEKLTSIFIPIKVEYLGGDEISGCFSGCSKLKEIIVDDRNPEFSSLDGVLFNKTKTLLIKYPEGKEDANYTIPDTVINIKDEAFFFCKELVNVTLHGRLSDFKRHTFTGCEKLENLILRDGNPGFIIIDGVLFHKHGKKLLFYPYNRKETEYAIPSGIKQINDGTFKNCKNLESVIFPESFKRIAGGAFVDCKKLKSITLPAGLEEICDYAFIRCKQLKKVILPRKTKIEPDAFDGSSVEFVYID
jgi:hypothetical protein